MRCLHIGQRLEADARGFAVAEMPTAAELALGALLKAPAPAFEGFVFVGKAALAGAGVAADTPFAGHGGHLKSKSCI